MFGWRRRAATCASRWKRCLTSSSIAGSTKVSSRIRLTATSRPRTRVAGAVHLAEGARAQARDDAVALAQQSREASRPAPELGDLQLRQLVRFSLRLIARTRPPAPPGLGHEGCAMVSAPPRARQRVGRCRLVHRAQGPEAGVAEVERPGRRPARLEARARALPRCGARGLRAGRTPARQAAPPEPTARARSSRPWPSASGRRSASPSSRRCGRSWRGPRSCRRGSSTTLPPGSAARAPGARSSSTGVATATGYRIGVRAAAPEPGGCRRSTAAGCGSSGSRSGRFEWTVREELARRGLRPARPRLRRSTCSSSGAEGSDEAQARAAIASAFPRASAKLGQLLRLERAGRRAGRAGRGEPARGGPADARGLRATAPRYAAFLEKYLTPIRTRTVVVRRRGRHVVDARGRAQPLDAAAARARRQPGAARGRRRSAGSRSGCVATMDYETRMGRFGIAAKGLVAEVALTRTPTEKGFPARFRKKPDWEPAVPRRDLPGRRRSATRSRGPGRRPAGPRARRRRARGSSATTAPASARTGCCAGSAG